MSEIIFQQLKPYDYFLYKDKLFKKFDNEFVILIENGLFIIHIFDLSKMNESIKVMPVIIKKMKIEYEVERE